MRFFPQSFEFSTLGGWVATRAGGHFATLWTHSTISSRTCARSRRRGLGVPAVARQRRRGSPDRMLLGSEGILGVITEAWVRVQPRPVARRRSPVRFPDLLAGAEAVRALVQARLHPSNCRLIDRRRPGSPARGRHPRLLVLGFEAVRPRRRARAGAGAACAAQHGGIADEAAAPASAVARLARGLSARPTCATCSCSSAWWPRPSRRRSPGTASRRSTPRSRRGAGCPGRARAVTCRFTHAYQDGPAPYFTVLVPARRGDEVEQWGRSSARPRTPSPPRAGRSPTTTPSAATTGPGTTPAPDPFAAALRAAKAAVDPRACSTPACSSILGTHERGGQELRGDHQGEG